MCLVALAIGLSPRFPLVIAANRDEFYDRPAAPMDWWSPEAGAAPILAGRDLAAGGTWMGLNAAGRFAFVTNVRGLRPADPDAPSRGQIVPDWLAGQEGFATFWPRTRLAGHNGFNLVAADFASGDWHWASNCADEPVRLGAGVHGVSNHLLDTPWPKVQQLKARLEAAVSRCRSLPLLADALFDALADRREAPADALPSTGIPPERERALSAAFVDMPDRGYGTRCSTLVVTERTERGGVTHVLERSFGSRGEAPASRRFGLESG